MMAAARCILLLLLCLCCLALGAPLHQDAPYKSSSAYPIEERVEALLQKMTLEEKVAQLLIPPTWAIPDLLKTYGRTGLGGFYLPDSNITQTNQVINITIKKSIFLFPTDLSLAAAKGFSGDLASGSACAMASRSSAWRRSRWNHFPNAQRHGLYLEHRHFTPTCFYLSALLLSLFLCIFLPSFIS